MIDTNTLKGIIVSRGKTQQDIAKVVGCSNDTFYRKMKKGVFGSDEIQKMIDELDIEDPMRVFFTNEVT